MLEPKQLTNIGFDHIIQNLQPFSVYGDELRRRVRPYKKDEREKLTAELENVKLLAEAFERDPASFSPLARALMLLKDIRRSLARSRETTLTDIELFEIKRFLIVLESLAAACAELPAARELNGVEIFPMTAALDIVDPDGMRAQTFRLPDDSSEELARIRRERKAADIALRTASPDEKDGLSAKRTRLAALEENEELRLRGEMTRAFAVYSEQLEELIESIARLDFALAKARLMLDLHGCVPEIAEKTGENEAKLVLTDMVNPALGAALREKGREFTPVSIELARGSTVITGANMGGKSVAVKTLALNAYLAMAGMPVFAKEAVLPMLSDIHLLAEDMEDSRGGLSSFGGEMVRFDAILRGCSENPGALVLLDEFARGTNPHEGSALVRAAVRYFEEKKQAFAVLTTHFDDVAVLAPVHYQVMGLRRADESALASALAAAEESSAGELLSRFMDYGLYRVPAGVNPPRDALRICRALGISDGFMRFVHE
ncbi:MAG: DNA mismatch repair protein MutS [Clostridia bacterium]|nr:DNA mismatch repair protein MutS [Clostridia bacterium]